MLLVFVKYFVNILGGMQLTDKKTMMIWAKRVVSLFSVGFIGLMAFLAYTSFYYDISITNRSSFTVLVVCLSLLFAGTMIFSRKQVVTSIVALVAPLCYLPIVVFYYSQENLIFLIPIGAITILLFFFGGAGEGLKTIVGTIYLLMYIICILAYFLYVSIFLGHTVDVVKEQSVSQTKQYRCYVLDITDNSKGTTKVIVEPNYLDIVYGSVTFIEKGYERIVYNVRENNLDLDLEWTLDSQGKDMLKVNGDVRFKATDAIKPELAYSFFVKDKRQWKFFK